RLVHGGRHLVGLAVAAGDAALVVADDNEGVEAEAPAALDDSGAAADLDDAGFETVLPLFPSATIAFTCHDLLFSIFLEIVSTRTAPVWLTLASASGLYVSALLLALRTCIRRTHKPEAPARGTQARSASEGHTSPKR